jgi:hypothetical protein
MTVAFSLVGSSLWAKYEIARVLVNTCKWWIYLLLVVHNLVASMATSSRCFFLKYGGIVPYNVTYSLLCYSQMVVIHPYTTKAFPYGNEVVLFFSEVWTLKGGWAYVESSLALNELIETVETSALIPRPHGNPVYSYKHTTLRRGAITVRDWLCYGPPKNCRLAAQLMETNTYESRVVLIPW